MGACGGGRPPSELTAHNAALVERLADLEARFAILETNHDEMADANNEASGFAPAALLVGLVLLVALARRRAQ